MKRWTLLTLVLVLSLILVACGGTEAVEPTEAPAVEEPTEAPPMEEAAPSIAEIAAGNEDFSTLVAALDAAGLVETLSGEGTFTVFAPTNDAFAALPEGTLDGLLADPQGQLTDILLYHVAGEIVPSSDIVNLDSVETLMGDSIRVEVVDGAVVLNGVATVTTTDIEASNGVIHVIDAVLIPGAQEEAVSIAEIAAGDENFSTLVAALDAAGLTETLAGEGEFTVFAPTNDAFAALPEGTLDELLADPQGQLTDILLYHVADGTLLAENVVATEAITTLQGSEIAVNVTDSGVILNDDITVTMTDIMASNGVIHVIDAVLLPPTDEDAEMVPSIAEIAAADENFGTLAAALGAAGLTETLAGEGEFTVFAPTNDAFAALPEGTLDELLADPQGQLTDILLYHVAEGTLLAENVVASDTIPTLQGSEISVSASDSGVVLNDNVNVTSIDIIASNGVIHVIDAVLLPPSEDESAMATETIAAIAAGNEDFSTLVAALEAAGLVETLDGEGEFTVFAPTNDAFAALPEGTLDELLADPQGALTDILLYHVVEGEAKAEDVVNLPSVTTLQGSDISILVTDDGVVLNGSVNVTATDIDATNGVIHVIDAVLIPSE